MRLSPAADLFGTVVHDLQLGVEHPESVWQQLRSTLLQRGVLIFPRQQLTDEQHVDVAEHFGPIAPELSASGSPTATFVSNSRPDGTLGSTAASYHIDFGFFPNPYRDLSLYGYEIPPGGTQTSFVSGVVAARRLPASLRARVAGLQARQAIDLACPAAQTVIRVREGRLSEAYPHMTRPVLWPHVETGEEILGVWQQHTDALLPLPPDESTALIEELYSHLYQPAHTYVHHWQRGDLVIWDNHALQHGRPEVGTEYPRTLRRVCIGQPQDLSLFAKWSAA